MARLFGVPLPARPGNGLMDTRGHARHILECNGSGQIAGRLGKTKTNVVVPVVRVVPVARRGTEVLRFVVPGTAADHTPAVLRPVPS
jgi:hypothetical protein